jgi:surface protein
VFAGCSGLTGIDLSAFNTSNVTNMNGMFSGCSDLKTLDLSNFNTGNVTDMSNMFNGCSSLTAISVGDDWSTASVTSSAGMFTGCNSLVGGNGTAHNSSYTDKTYARVDADGTPGYLSYLTAIAYVAFTEGESGTLTFYYDSWRAQREAEGKDAAVLPQQLACCYGSCQRMTHHQGEQKCSPFTFQKDVKRITIGI